MAYMKFLLLVTYKINYLQNRTCTKRNTTNTVLTDSNTQNLQQILACPSAYSSLWLE